MKIAICTPCYDDVTADFAYRLAKLMFRTGQTEIEFNGEVLLPQLELFMRSSSALPQLRNMLLQDAMAWGANYLLWLDTDQTFPEETLLRLLSLNLPVVGVNAPRRVRPDWPTAKGLDGKPVRTTEEVARANEVAPVLGLGFNCCLIDMTVLETLRASAIARQSLLAVEMGGNATQIWGDDVFFFRALEQVGIPVHVDHALSLSVGQVRQRVPASADGAAATARPEATKGSATLHEQARGWSRSDWNEAVIQSVGEPVIEGVKMPGFPPEHLQVGSVGRSGEPSMREAATFTDSFKIRATELRTPISSESRVLDFGCGWGRMIRYFSHEVPDDQLFGVDVDSNMIRTCVQTNVPGQFQMIERDGRLPFEDGFFTHIFSYSVFTHLPRNAVEHWLSELNRVCAPGSLFCLTVEPPRFVDFVIEEPQESANYWHKLLHEKFSLQAKEIRPKLDEIGYAFFPTKGDDFANYYGDSVYTAKFIRDNWSSYFDLLEYLDDPQQFWQAFVLMRRV